MRLLIALNMPRLTQRCKCEAPARFGSAAAAKEWCGASGILPSSHALSDNRTPGQVVARFVPGAWPQPIQCSSRAAASAAWLRTSKTGLVVSPVTKLMEVMIRTVKKNCEVLRCCQRTKLRISKFVRHPSGRVGAGDSPSQVRGIGGARADDSCFRQSAPPAQVRHSYPSAACGRAPRPPSAPQIGRPRGLIAKRQLPRQIARGSQPPGELGQLVEQAGEDLSEPCPRADALAAAIQRTINVTRGSG